MFYVCMFWYYYIGPDQSGPRGVPQGRRLPAGRPAVGRRPRGRAAPVRQVRQGAPAPGRRRGPGHAPGAIRGLKKKSIPVLFLTIGISFLNHHNKLQSN